MARETDNYTDFYTQLGCCVSEWAHVDTYLFLIFYHCLGAPEDRASILYYRNNAISARCELVHEMMLHRGEVKSWKRRLEAWKRAKAQFDKLIPFRNRLAHEPVGVIQTETKYMHAFKGETTHIDQEYYVYTFGKERLRGKKREAPLIHINDLINHMSLVMSLETDLLSLARSFSKTRKRKSIAEPAWRART